jgi:methylenetetrahydrofolate reductase (NADPH)
METTGGVVREALRRPRYEVIPIDGVADAVAASVPRDIQITVTASPRRGLPATIDLTERLRGHGYDVTPHLAARLVTSEHELKEIVERVGGLGVRDVFVIGGDVEEPAGPFRGADELLVAMEEIGHPFTDVGITGYPESHPIIADDVLIQSMWDKSRHATYVVSQVCFTSRPIVAWVDRVRRRGVELPIHIGLPGIVDRRKLLRIVRGIGLGESGRFLRQHKNWFWRLGMPGAYSPRRLLGGLDQAVADPRRGIGGFHFFTFNELEKTERWRQEMLVRLATHGNGKES